MNNLNIIGNSKRISRFDPDLARKVTEEHEQEQRKKKLGSKKEASKPNAEALHPFPLDVKSNIKGEDYIRIPGTTTIISRQESNKGLNWENTHYTLAENGLYMPSPSLFMPYFMHVRDASQGNTTLYTAGNNPIPTNEAEELWKYLSTDYNNGCWTWLDAKFSEENNVWKIGHNHKVIQKGKDKSLEGKTETLESCIRKDCFVDLEFNTQGLPIRKSQNQNYKQGENIYYWHPRNKTVARFYADSGRAFLSCGRNPSGSNRALGVFACAEGAQKNN